MAVVARTLVNGHMMQEINRLYAKLLEFGLHTLRVASYLQDKEWLDAEIEMLHNIPSLIGEESVERHRYNWFQERKNFLRWVDTSGREEAKSRTKTFYEPVWRELKLRLEEFAKPKLFGNRSFGLCKGEFVVPDDFDDPLPEEILRAFERKDDD